MTIGTNTATTTHGGRDNRESSTIKNDGDSGKRAIHARSGCDGSRDCSWIRRDDATRHPRDGGGASGQADGVPPGPWQWALHWAP